MEFQAYAEYLKTVSTGWKALAAFGGSFFEDVKRQRRLGYSLVDCYNRTFVRLKQYCDLFKVCECERECITESVGELCAMTVCLSSLLPVYVCHLYSGTCL